MGNVAIALNRSYRSEPTTRRRTFTLTPSASYATTGDVIPAAEIAKIFPHGDLTKTDNIHVNVSAKGRLGTFDKAAARFKVYQALAVYTATFDPASLAAITSRDDAITVTGVAATDECVRVEAPAAIAASVVVQGARVTALNTITVRLTNPSAGAVDVASGTWKFYVAAAGGAAHEVPSGTDLSADTFDCEILYEDVKFAHGWYLNG